MTKQAKAISSVMLYTKALPNGAGDKLVGEGGGNGWAGGDDDAGDEGAGDAGDKGVGIEDADDKAGDGAGDKVICGKGVGGEGVGGDGGGGESAGAGAGGAGGERDNLENVASYGDEACDVDFTAEDDSAIRKNVFKSSRMIRRSSSSII